MAKKGFRTWDKKVNIDDLREGDTILSGTIVVPAPNPKKAYGDLKVPLHLVPASADIAIARGLAEGAAKYGAWNWREADVEYMTYIGAIRRHLAAFVEGEDRDPDSKNGKTHLDGAIASLAILIDAHTGGFGIDNRPTGNIEVLVALEEGSNCHALAV